MKNNIWIIGCGDIGKRVAKLHQNEKISGIVQSESSVLACNELGINVNLVDFDQEIKLPDLLSQPSLQSLQPSSQAPEIYYFMPPPQMGCEDTRIQQFLSSLNQIVPKRIVLISTTGVYGDSKGGWVDEASPVQPKADRAYRRLSAEKALINWSNKTGGEYMILRVPGIYAEDRLPLARLKKGLPIVRLEEAGWTNRIHADDLAQACKAAMACDTSNQVINVSDGHPSTMTDYFNQIADYANLERPRQISMKKAEETLSAGMVSYLKESRRIRNDKMLTLLGIKLKYPNLSFFIKAKN